MANKPANTIRIGNVKAVIWANKTGDNTFYNVNLVRSFKNDKGDWSDGDSFNHSDLPVVAKVADMATEWIALQ